MIKSARILCLVAIIVQIFVWFSIPLTSFASFQERLALQDLAAPPLETVRSKVSQQTEQATLQIEIVSSPWAILDHNDPGGTSGQVPQVFVVEAVITNTSTTVAATDLVVSLDYNENPTVGWVLLSGEDAERTQDQLAPQEAYHAYWLARYPAIIGASHQYTVTAYASNAAMVSTSENHYAAEGLGPDETVKTRAYQSTGNSGLDRTSSEVVVGVAFTMTVEYDLGTKAKSLVFGPVGNADFVPDAYRLINSEVRFLSDDGLSSSVVPNRLYFPSVPSFATRAKATYEFIALTLADAQICSYTGVGYQSSDKYDVFFCDEVKGTTVPVQGQLRFSMVKNGSALEIQQGQTLTYTLDYINESEAYTLTHIWVWDDVDTGMASIVPSSVDPPSDPGETTTSRAAWNVGDIPPSGWPNSTGTLTFTIDVDGNSQDLADDTDLVNYAFLGIEPGRLPRNAALTSTFTTTIRAPTISLDKTDGYETVENGQDLTYTLRITNSGSIAATGVVITDTLPDGVTFSGGANPAEPDSVDGQSLVWTSLGPISPEGGTIVITIPVTVRLRVPNGTVLDNKVTVKYENPAGWVYTPKVAQDTTTVNAPVLSISKSDFPDPVISGHTISYTLSYENSGAADATNIVITDTIPADATYIDDSCRPAPCSATDGIVSWAIDTLSSDTSGVVSFAVLVDSALDTGDVIHNDLYGIVADQFAYLGGLAQETVVNRDAGYVEGYAYDDENGNGTWDGGESGLAGVTITLTKATVPVTTTNGDGYYRFRIETAEPISVTAAPVVDYFQTTAGTVYTNSLLGVTQTVNFGYASDGSSFGVINGIVFEDVNHNGVQNLGENGLPDVTVTIDESTPVTTDEYGRYTIAVDSTPHTLVETDLPPYVSTTSNEVVATVPNGTAASVDFGDFMGIMITGQVFDDANANGQNDDALVISAVTVAADGDSTQTDGSGNYVLFVAVDGSNPITITETDLLDYLSTNAVPGAAVRRLDANRLRIDNPAAGQEYGGDFGDVEASTVVTISGHVWQDTDVDGQLDGGELYLEGVTVTLSSGMSQVTGSDGSFALYALPGVAITVTQQNLSGYTSINAIPGNDATKWDNDTLLVNPLIVGSSSVGNLFGDAPSESVAVLTGIVYEDENVNGRLDAGEPGLPGVAVTLETGDGNVRVVYTGAAGDYEHAVAPGTDVRLTCSGPGGDYQSTTPQSVVVRPTSAGVFSDNNFGYNDDGIAIIYGVVFDDVNGNGEQDLGELGLSDAVITLDGERSFTTGGSGLIVGTFVFTTELDVHAVTEANPSAYPRSTTPDLINVVVATPTSYYVDFGDTSNLFTATIYGSVFDDNNGNGLQDPSEPGVPGVVVSMTAGLQIITATTKNYGQYAYGFEVGEAGFYTIREQDPVQANWRSTTPDNIVLNVVMSQSYIVNFGDTATNAFSTIMGSVFDDQDGNGVQDPGEVGIENVPVTLYRDGQVISVTATYSHGIYTLAVFDTGPVQVVETDLDGYHSTTPNTVTVNVESLGQLYRHLNFGDSLNPFASSIYGTVFDDQNASGVRDPVEPALSGVTVAITRSLSELVQPYVTNSWGQYTFQIEFTGTFTITETDLDSYVSTVAIPGNPAVTAPDRNTFRAQVDSLGTDLDNNVFGDVQASQVFTISGYVWDDNGADGGTAGDGAQNGSEPYLPGAVIALDSGMSQSTASDGAFLLYAPAGQPVTVTETNPEGYVSTIAIPGNDATVWNQDTITVTGLSGGASSTGHLFGDVLPAGLAIAKSVHAETVVAGRSLTYTLVYTNDGPSFAQSVYITDILPVGVSFGGIVSQDPEVFNFSSAGQQLTWYTDSLPSGARGTIVFTVSVDSDAGAGDVVNHVSITSNMPDTQLDNNDDEATTRVTNDADLRIVKVGDPESVAAGATLTYTLTYANDGPSDAQATTITDTLPTQVTWDGIVSQDPVLPAPTLDGQQLAWDIPSLETGASGTIVYTVIVNPGASGAVINGVVITSSTPDSRPGNNSSVNSAGIGTPGLATIYGTVFEDADADGERDVGEAGIPGVTITLDGVDTTTTDQNALYVIFSDASGTHSIVETDPDGYVSTTPNEVHVDVELGSSYGVDFGDAPPGAGIAVIHGTVFADADADGEWDAGEVGVSSVTVWLDGTASTATDAYGRYSFVTTQAGVHTVVETDLGGYVSTTPNEAHVDVELGNSYEVDFGDAPPGAGIAVLHGVVFQDVDADGEWDAGEVGLSDVTVALDGTTSTATDAYGRYVFTTAVVGTHTLVETDPSGYLSTTPNQVTVDVTAVDQSYVANFGDVLPQNCCNQDAYEEDDVAEKAQALGIGEVQDRNFCDDATDWLTITVKAGRVYTITTSSWGRRADTFVALFDGDASTMLVANDDHEGTTDFSSSLVWQADRDGIYYVRITNRAGLSGCATDYQVWIEYQDVRMIYLPILLNNYAVPTTSASLSVETIENEVSPAGVIDHVCKDAYEIDDSWQQAKGIEPGIAQVHSFDSDPTYYAADKDFVWFEIEANRTITFTATPVDGSATLLELYDASGLALGQEASTQLVWAAPAAGRYLLSVSPGTNAFGCALDAGYSLLAEMEPQMTIYLPFISRNFAP